jgi:hypothetical protein
MYNNLKWIMIFSMCMLHALLISKQSNSPQITSKLRWVHLLLMLLACVFSTWHHSLMKLICESTVYFHEEEDVLIDCGHWSSKRITLFLIWNPYTPCSLVVVNSIFFISFFFFCLKFYLYLNIHIVHCLMHLQCPFACKYKIHQGNCSTNNWQMVRIKSEAFKKVEIQWVWTLTIRKSLHLSLLCTNVLVV